MFPVVIVVFYIPFSSCLKTTKNNLKQRAKVVSRCYRCLLYSFQFVFKDN
ncbi:hypothetical protein HMPREF9136_1713 [Prevotella dentalis DSM 3688]|uniref:Uncharacterized protein n=1 Tax=Prevotella dentalis (strain ATCC 49559 / DSM 3688 / JCM 13448 / NCTC 12043 / ES 2772) TaxID=908937 RepID=F9D4D5_PREDD|nr:hypothetical protein HMPREF9136_1713 [Prevotella dentalis DSM 3688]